MSGIRTHKLRGYSSSCKSNYQYDYNHDGPELMINGLKSTSVYAINTYNKVVTESGLNFESFTVVIIAC